MFDWSYILDFWFGELDDDGLPSREKRDQWFAASRALDREIRQRFLSLVLVASEDGLSHWRHDPRGALAEIILLDQFPRNIYRRTRMAFEYDGAARKRCREGLKQGLDTLLEPVMRGFFYMPLQHSERLQDQETALELYEQLAALGQNPRLKQFLNNFLRFARYHHEIIARFGRFPHRNAILGRSSTPEEEAFLGDGASHFGQGES
ncbi:DUF924 family protein [Marinobacteraceae bacterium S3BR75-40.1]